MNNIDHKHKWIPRSFYRVNSEWVHYQYCQIKNCDSARIGVSRHISNYCSLQEILDAAAGLDNARLNAKIYDDYEDHCIRLSIDGNLSISKQEFEALEHERKQLDIVEKTAAIALARKVLKDLGED